MITTFITTRIAEITCSVIFIAGLGVYGYIKNKGNNKHKLVYYNLSDRVIKGKKIQQKISDRVGGSGKNDTFFKAS
jgi:hypothetical protein